MFMLYLIYHSLALFDWERSFWYARWSKTWQ